MGLLTIIYEDNHLLVVNKPPLLATMGVQAGEDSLVARAKEFLREKYHKPGNVFVGVVSRLDSWVSGVIVLARTSKAAGRLNEQFRNRQVKKTYLAIIPDDKSLAESGELRHRLKKDERKHCMIAYPSDGPSLELLNFQSAVLNYETLGRYNGLRLISIQLETGRKHQIRVQFASEGCPIIGDRKYGSMLDFSRGIALHSYKLEFRHPTREEMLCFRVDPPSDWNLARFKTAISPVDK